MAEEGGTRALEGFREAGHRAAQEGEPPAGAEGGLGVARAFQEGSQALLRGAYREALHRYGEGLGLLEKKGLPFPATALALLALAQEGFRPGGKGRETARKALERAKTPFAREVAERLLAQDTKAQEADA